MAFATADERYFVNLVNQVRKDKNLPTLKIEQSLNTSADNHSQWMLDADVFSHTGKGGSSSTNRMKDAGFDFAGSWMSAENLAYVSVDNDGSYRDEIQTMHKMLMNSPGHYANIVNASVNLIGIGLKVGDFNGYKVLVATQNFAKTSGSVDIDTNGFTFITAPSASAAVASRSDWRDSFDGKTFTSNATGTGRNDDFQLNSANNHASGQGGNDWMDGRAGNDTLNGGAGADRIMGQTGNDLLRGGDGNDSILGHVGADRLYGDNQNDLLRGGGGADQLYGGSGNDRLFGDAGNDRLIGGSGNDWLRGMDGADTVIGGAGNDTLRGGAGNDVLKGGAGADTFIFHDGGGRDTINGFVADTDRLLVEKELLGNNGINFTETKITNTASGVIINFGDGDVLVINGRGLNPGDIVDDIFAI
ncbi:hypothetical protein H4P12_17510 [Paracoccus sp. 11-3]|uniref:SCP domain-containing protein n=1 Tax=Paracoccus amoyensis TaxID=2760093 RepID=A0A926GCH1_9RHOB|nr:CAP domain-containing protein [Paracoccus amoyensis]MBC9248463.1 hypothetical protein [Paracoccus amoyensis]